MSREEAIGKWIYPAIATMWNAKTCNEILEALEQEPCDDAISRNELLKAIDTWDKFGCDANNKLVPYQDHYVPYIHYDDVVKCIKGMPSVNPQPKTGHWIELPYDEIDCVGFVHKNYKCSECGYNKGTGNSFMTFRYCPNCGAKMKGEE